tara:strand:+ start:22 stop:555 length:534 start_codon:yes stop_codon:yes gene_type:complete
MINLINNHFQLKSIFSYKLKQSDIEDICLLKDKQWKYGINSQKEWFKKYVKKQDTHNLLYLKSKLIGYTLLRKKVCKIEDLNKKKNFIYFDTLIIDKKYRNKKLSYLLMCLNNMFIKQSKLFSILICQKKQVNFYKKNGWLQVKKGNIQIFDHRSSAFCMIFNAKNKNNKYKFYINK